MLKINVGLSRKVSQDYQSKGFSLNIEGELPSEILTDQNALAEAADNLFTVANQLLDEQIQKATSVENAPRTRRPSRTPYPRPQNGHTRQPQQANGYRQNSPPQPVGTNGNHTPNGNGNGERLLTQAQSRAIGNMARKLGQDPDQWVQEQYGVVQVGELTLKQASEAIDLLKQSIEKVGVG